MDTETAREESKKSTSMSDNDRRDIVEILLEVIEDGSPLVEELVYEGSERVPGNKHIRFKITPEEAKECLKEEVDANSGYYLEKHGEKVYDKIHYE